MGGEGPSGATIAAPASFPLMRGQSAARGGGNRSVSVIIPVHDEEKNLESLLGEIRRALGEEAEVVVVDDGSQDRSAEVAAAHGAVVYRHPYNIGNGAAVKTGIEKARGEHLILMDGDGQHNPQDMVRLLEGLETHHLVVGARTADSITALHRRWANQVYNRLASYVTRHPVADLTSGFRAIRREEALHCLPMLPNTFSYPSTMTLFMLRAGKSVHFVPVRALGRKGKSKIRVSRDGLRFFFIILKVATLVAPLRIFLPVSVALFFLGLGWYLYTYFTYHRFTNMAVLLFVNAVVIFMLGLVAEQIAQLRADLADQRSRSWATDRPHVAGAEFKSPPPPPPPPTGADP